MFETDKVSIKSKKVKPGKKKTKKIIGKPEIIDEKIEKLLLLSSGCIEKNTSKKVFKKVKQIQIIF